MIKQALFSLGFGALGGLVLQSVMILVLPQTPRFAQVDLVEVMQDEIESMAKTKIDGNVIDPNQRAARVQSAIADIAAETGRTIIVRQALIAGPAGDVPDYTQELKARLK
jgi:hypothetical protein